MLTTHIPNNRDRVIAQGEVRALFGGIARATLYRLVKRGFPPPVYISPNRVGWLQSELDAYIQKIRDARDAGHSSPGAANAESSATRSKRTIEGL